MRNFLVKKFTNFIFEFNLDLYNDLLYEQLLLSRLQHPLVIGLSNRSGFVSLV